MLRKKIISLKYMRELHSAVKGEVLCHKLLIPILRH